MTTGMVRRVLVPVTIGSDEDHLIFTATVLARWFDAAVQLIANDPADLQHLRMLSEGLGAKYEPPILLESADFLQGVAGHAAQVGPSVTVVGLDDGGVDLAKINPQPTFVTGARVGHRLESGPLVVEVSSRVQRLDALAVAAVWAQTLDLGIRVVVGTGDVSRDDLSAAVGRLREMGIDVGVDSLRTHGFDPVVLVARSRHSTAIVVAADRVTRELVERAAREGLSVLVAPVDENSEPLLPKGFAEKSPGHEVLVLDDEECLARLEGQSVGRVGYIDDGWPNIVPVNFSNRDGAIFFRSLVGGKLSAARRHAVVCLEVDGFDVDSKSGWSVLAHGELEVIDDPMVLKTAWRNDPAPWVESEHWQWLRLVPISVSGRLVAARDTEARAD